MMTAFLCPHEQIKVFRHGNHLFNPPVLWVVPHSREGFFCRAHNQIVLYMILHVKKNVHYANLLFQQHFQTVGPFD